MTKGLCELLWLKMLLTKIGFSPTLEISFFRDNKAAINISHNPIQHDKTKHMEVDWYKYNLETKIIRFSFVTSKNHLADILIKKIVLAKNSTAH